MGSLWEWVGSLRTTRSLHGDGPRHHPARSRRWWVPHQEVQAREPSRVATAGPSAAAELSLMTASGIGPHNFAEGHSQDHGKQHDEPGRQPGGCRPGRHTDCGEAPVPMHSYQQRRASSTSSESNRPEPIMKFDPLGALGVFTGFSLARCEARPRRLGRAS